MDINKRKVMKEQLKVHVYASLHLIKYIILSPQLPKTNTKF